MCPAWAGAAWARPAGGFQPGSCPPHAAIRVGGAQVNPPGQPALADPAKLQLHRVAALDLLGHRLLLLVLGPQHNPGRLAGEIGYDHELLASVILRRALRQDNRHAHVRRPGRPLPQRQRPHLDGGPLQRKLAAQDAPAGRVGGNGHAHQVQPPARVARGRRRRNGWPVWAGCWRAIRCPASDASKPAQYRNGCHQHGQTHADPNPAARPRRRLPFRHDRLDHRPLAGRVCRRQHQVGRRVLRRLRHDYLPETSGALDLPAAGTGVTPDVLVADRTGKLELAHARPQSPFHTGCPATTSFCLTFRTRPRTVPLANT